jgi:exoribonuclease R
VGALAAGFDAIRAELGISDTFPPEVLAEAEESARRGPAVEASVDRRGVPFVTIDPPQSLDLDQAVCVSRDGRGYLVQYAIADVAAFVPAGGRVDAESRQRAVTIYLPDKRARLHPPGLSEGAASLLPDGDRQALLWDIRLGADGDPVDATLTRALVRSRAKLSYDEVQADLDAGRADDRIALIREVGVLLQAREADRGGVSLPLPEQHVVAEAGTYRLEYRAPLPVEGWNAQISLLTGRCAAKLMLEGGVGVLRTLSPPDDDAVAMLRRAASALDVEWPPGSGYDDLIRSLEPKVATHAALLASAARLFRGAGYLAFRDGAPPPEAVVHAAVAAPYAHVTAPLRRLVDRFGNEVVLALCARRAVPDWALEALPALPDLMDAGRRREAAADSMALDLVEAAILSGRIGDVVTGVVLSRTKSHVVAQIRDPAVITRVDAPRRVRPGQQINLRVVSADIPSRRVGFTLVDGPPSNM